MAKEKTHRMLPVHEWLNIDLLKMTARHCSGSAFVIVCFSAVAWIARHTMHEGPVLRYIEIVDSIVIVGCITWLALIMFWELATIFRRVVKGENDSTNSVFLG